MNCAKAVAFRRNSHKIQIARNVYGKKTLRIIVLAIVALENFYGVCILAVIIVAVVKFCGDNASNPARFKS